MLGRVRAKVQVKTVDQSTSETKSTEKRCWTWSIYPLLVLAQIIGVDLVPTATSCRQKWTLFYRIFCLLMNAFVYFDFLIIFYHHFDEISFYFITEGEIVTKTYMWNLSIDCYSFFIGNLGCHLILVLIIRNRWSSLNVAFSQSEFLLDTKFYLKLRRLSLVGVAYVTFGVVVAGMAGIVSRFWKKTSLHIKLMTFSSVIFQVYPIFSLLLTSIALYASSGAFQSITLKLQHWHEQYRANNYLTGANLSTLKSYYVQACRTVDTVQVCFGWSLLMIISYHFVTVINMTFYLFGQLKNNYSVSDIVFFILYFSNPFIICSAAECVRVQSDNVLKTLLRMQIKPIDKFHKKQVSQFVWQVVLSSPRISALGFFGVGKKLIPTMIGTTLTYYVILRQFHLSESQVSTR